MNGTLFSLVLGALTAACSSVRKSSSQLYLACGGVRNNQYYYTDKFGNEVAFNKYFQEKRQYSNHLAAVKTDGKKKPSISVEKKTYICIKGMK